MTSSATNSLIGLTMAVAGSTAGLDLSPEGLLTSGVTLTGAGLMVIHTMRLYQEMRQRENDRRKERAELLKLVQEAQEAKSRACAECSLAKGANRLVVDAATQHITHNNSDKQ